MSLESKAEKTADSNDAMLHNLGYASLAVLGVSGLFYLGSLLYRKNNGTPAQKIEAKKDLAELETKITDNTLNLELSKKADTNSEVQTPTLKRRPSTLEIHDAYLKVKSEKSNLESTPKSAKSLGRKTFPDIIPGNHSKSKSIIQKTKYFLPKRYNTDKGKKIYKFVITGGPCAGKSTCMTWLSEKFKPKYEVFIVPETATLTINAGYNILPDRFNAQQHCEVITNIMKYQLDMENYFYEIAKDETKDVIIITDRGMLDNFAYCKPEVKEMVLKKTGWKISEINQQ